MHSQRVQGNDTNVFAESIIWEVSNQLILRIITLRFEVEQSWRSRRRAPRVVVNSNPDPSISIWVFARFTTREVYPKVIEISRTSR